MRNGNLNLQLQERLLTLTSHYY